MLIFRSLKNKSKIYYILKFIYERPFLALLLSAGAEL